MKKWVEETGKRFLWTVAVMALALVSLSAHGAPGVEVGDAAPDFTLSSTTGKTIALSQFQGKKSVLLEFYVADLGAT